jgi:hypothetical protein
MKTRIILVAVLAIVFCLASQSGFAADRTVVKKASQEEMNFSEAFWTPDKVRAAKPHPWYDEEADLGPKAKLFKNEPVGPPGSAPGARPSKTFGSYIVDEGQAAGGGESFAAGDSDSGISEEFAEDFGTKNVFDDTYVNGPSPTILQTQYPWKAIGKLFFRNLSGGTSSCTASVISPNDIIVTAAHCCYERGRGFYSNWRFYPAYRNGNAPLGNYGYVRARVLTAWVNTGGRQNDVCVIRLNGDASARTGYLGRSWNYSITQHHRAFGYPGNIGSGNYLIECAAESYANCGSSLVYGMGCSQTYGASGGPWLRGFEMFKSGAYNYVNSVVSGWDGTCTGTFGQSFNGARFTTSNIVTLCNAEGC